NDGRRCGGGRGGGGGAGRLQGCRRRGRGGGTRGPGAGRGAATPAHLHQGMSYAIASSVAPAKAGPIITASGIWVRGCAGTTTGSSIITLPAPPGACVHRH